MVFSWLIWYICKEEFESVGEMTMEWINIFGVIFILIIMIPNIIYALKIKDGFGEDFLRTL